MSGSQFSVAGRVGSSDTNDWYSFVTTQAETINLDLSALYGNPEISLYNSTSSQSLAYAYASQTGDGWVNELVQPGTYYVDISASSDTSYGLSVSSITPSVGTGPITSGTTLATAVEIGTLTSTAQSFTGGLTSGSESAFYAFNVSGISSVKVQLLGVTAGGLVYLRNAAGQQLTLTAYSPTSDGSIIDTLGSLSTGTYYIDIEGYETTSTGYSLSVAATPLTANAGSTLSTARALGALGTTTVSLTDSLNALTTQEYYSFTLGAVARLDAEVSGLTAGVTLTLEDASGNRITSASGSATSSASLLTDLAPLASGTYYLDVSGATTPYTIAVNATPIANVAGSSASSADSLGTVSTTPITVTDFVGTVDPVDYYSFVVSSQTTVNAVLSAYNGDDSSNASLSLFNASGTAIVSSATASGQANALVDTVLQAGTYTAEVTTTVVEAPYTLSLSTGTPSVTSSTVQAAGNSIATATSFGTLTANTTTYSDYVGPGASAYGVITVASPSLLSLQATGLSGGNVLNISLLDRAGDTLQVDGTNNSSTQGASFLDEVAAGTYYVELTDAGAGTDYSLAESATPLPTTAGSTSASAKSLGNLGTLQSFSGFVGAAETDNYYEFTLSSAAVVTLDLATRAADVGMTLRDVSGQSLANQNASSTGDAIQVQPLAAGTYYVDVGDVFGVGADYSLSLSATPTGDPAGATQSAADLLGTLTNGGTVQSSGASTIDAGSGSATVTIPSGAQYVTTEGNNTIVLNGGSPTVSASTGNPLVYGGSSALTFVGGSGAATVIGGSAGNTITGGSGSLVLFGVSATTYTTGTGAATIVGGSGGLTASLGAGGGEIFGGTGGVNMLSASGGTAALVGVGSGDILTASAGGGDILVAGAGAETLNAAQSTGNDVLFGGSGADSMVGGSGNDYFLAGSGNETLTGNGGFNAYVFVSGSAARTDTITDFVTSRTVIGLFNYGSNADAAALSSAVTSGGSTTVTLPDGTSIILPGVTGLTSANFL